MNQLGIDVPPLLTNCVFKYNNQSMDAFINNRKYSIIETMPKDKISKIKTQCTPNLEIQLSRAKAEIDFLKEPLRLLEIKQEKLK